MGQRLVLHLCFLLSVALDCAGNRQYGPRLNFPVSLGKRFKRKVDCTYIRGNVFEVLLMTIDEQRSRLQRVQNRWLSREGSGMMRMSPWMTMGRHGIALFCCLISVSGLCAAQTSQSSAPDAVTIAPARAPGNDDLPSAPEPS